MFSDLRYLGAYVLPLCGFLAFGLRGPWVWLPTVFAFGLVPLLEFLPAKPLSESHRGRRLPDVWFDLLLLGNIPVVFGLVWQLAQAFRHDALLRTEAVGLVLGTGIVLGACGINVAHELGHRASRVQRAAGLVLLLPALYLHFQIEHNRGHHVWVATPQDPSSARRGEPLFAFWFRSVTGTWGSAWRLCAESARRKGRPWANAMAGYTTAEVLYLGSIGSFFGSGSVMACALAGAVGFLLLETINYIEHYGLVRGRRPDGRWERPGPMHSWNSEHVLGRIILYELVRHTDHHMHAGKKFPELDGRTDAPALPFGYPACMLLAMVPPLWFRVMDRRLERYCASPLNRV